MLLVPEERNRRLCMRIRKMTETRVKQSGVAGALEKSGKPTASAALKKSIIGPLRNSSIWLGFHF